ncbi:CpaF family protein [Humisphaera borealis]|uniref:CpaF family protein n=1 Tax=Humisphaera borealis TaxID=2807512 RepID=A0A7M2WQH9_9BACT|nr:CpaF family protein [Humisphaera borealis]QOV87795.1 CpaF family protein [Humisphaera borealis]
MIADNAPTADTAIATVPLHEIKRLRFELLAAIQGDLRGGEQLPPAEARPRLEARFVELMPHVAPNLSTDIQQMLIRQALDEVCGFGPIQSLLDDPSVTEVMVNRHDRVYAERAGRSTLTSVKFDDDQHVRRVIDRIIIPIGRHVDTKNPLVDARLPDGSRVNACIPPVAIDGCNVTIRKFPTRRLTIQDLVKYGSISENMARFMEACVVARTNIVVSGGTGSGKTTLLNVLSSFIPTHERIVTIEDAAELQLGQDQVVRLESKKPEIDGSGAVTIRDLVRNALRMRPDRIVVGECRGGETLDMLQAMNTGHDGSLTTLHANTPRDAVSRIETMALMGGIDFPVRVVREQLASAVQLIVQQSRLRDGTRKITHITEIAGMEGERVVMQDLFRFHEEGVDENGKIKGSLRPSGLRPSFQEKLEAHGFDLPAEMYLPNGGGMGHPNQRPGSPEMRAVPAMAGAAGGAGADNGKKKGWW